MSASSSHSNSRLFPETTYIVQLTIVFDGDNNAAAFQLRELKDVTLNLMVARNRHHLSSVM